MYMLSYSIYGVLARQTLWMLSLVQILSNLSLCSCVPVGRVGTIWRSGVSRLPTTNYRKLYWDGAGAGAEMTSTQTPASGSLTARLSSFHWQIYSWSCRIVVTIRRWKSNEMSKMIHYIYLPSFQQWKHYRIVLATTTPWNASVVLKLNL